MNNYITQFKVLFCLSWAVLYLFFPAWRIPGRDFAFADNFAITKLMVYFTVSAYLLNRYFSFLTVGKPIIIKNIEWFKYIKNNAWLVLICSLSVVLHIHTFSFLINLGEMPFLRQTFWMYDFMNGHWRQFFDFPIQYFFWGLIIFFVLLVKQKKMINFMSNHINKGFSVYGSNNLTKAFYIIIIFGFFNLYAYLFPYYSWNEAMQILRYPPVSRFLYLITYSVSGVSDAGPRTVQLIFYTLSAVYLYRTIYLFREKEVALLGAGIYLFSPIIFSYAAQAALTSGTVFFIILISYYFLAFIKGQDNRDLLLTTYFIGVGFLYKRVVLLMFIICLAYLLLSMARKREWASILHLKILILSLIPVLPWLRIGSSVFEPLWHRLISFDSLITYSLMIQSQVSWIIFIMLLFSFIFIFFTKRDDVPLFFGLLFIAYYLFFTITKNAEFNHRYVTAFYPAIAYFLAQFIFSITKRIRWKYTFKLASSVLTIYLIIICMIPRASSNIITYKYKDFETQYYPIDKATEWIKNRTGNKEKIVGLHFTTDYTFYLQRIYPNRNLINQDRLIFRGYGAEKSFYRLQNLKKYCYARKISYVMLPYSPNNAPPSAGNPIERQTITKYLKNAMDMDDEFIEAAKFNIEDNFIVIYKVTPKLNDS